jgi:16S rRNA (guanine966-N2)-methyltransferase
MREGLFSSLGGDLTGVSFLDLFAGSGAVGLEAASRGAAAVHVVERDAAALTALRANVAALGLTELGPTALGLTEVHVHAQSVSKFLQAPAPLRFDIVFLDPPYADPVEGTLGMLVEGEWLAADATVVVERAARDAGPPWPAGLVTDRSRRYGDGTLWYGRRP